MFVLCFWLQIKKINQREPTNLVEYNFLNLLCVFFLCLHFTMSQNLEINSDLIDQGIIKFVCFVEIKRQTATIFEHRKVLAMCYV